VKFDDPARRDELAFEEPFRRSHPGRRTTRPDNTLLQRSRSEARAALKRAFGRTTVRLWVGVEGALQTLFGSVDQ